MLRRSVAARDGAVGRQVSTSAAAARERGKERKRKGKRERVSVWWRTKSLERLTLPRVFRSAAIRAHLVPVRLILPSPRLPPPRKPILAMASDIIHGEAALCFSYWYCYKWRVLANLVDRWSVSF